MVSSSDIMAGMLSKEASAAGVGSFLAKGMKRVVLPTVAAGTVVGGGVYANGKARRSLGKLGYDRSKTTGYQRSVASNLRQGKLSRSNLSGYDQGIANNMYKIGSLAAVGKGLWGVGKKTAMPAYMASTIPGAGKEMAGKYSLQKSALSSSRHRSSLYNRNLS